MIELTRLFTWVLDTSLAAGALVLLILGLQATVGRRWPARWHSALWLVLVLRMCLPGPLLPVGTWFHARTATVELRSSPEGRDPTAAVPALTVTPGPVASRAWAERFHGATQGQLPARIWGLGVLAVLGWLLWTTVRLSQAVRRGRVVTREPVLVLLEEVKASLGVHTVLGLVETDRVNSPALFGLLRPRLLLPPGLLDRLEPEAIRNIFRHELVHLDRLDLLLGWLAALLQALHWFNPLLWFGFHRLRRDRFDLSRQSHVEDRRPARARNLEFLPVLLLRVLRHREIR